MSRAPLPAIRPFAHTVAFILLATAPASAQAPIVSINGVVDQYSSYGRNQSVVDVNYTRYKDTEWYAHTRVRPDITAKVGTALFVLGIEIDFTWGQVGDKPTAGTLGASPFSAPGSVGSFPQRFGTSAGAALNTDLEGIVEIKWAYTEFDVPWVPWPTRLRLGAQPFTDTLKLGILTTGDFAGAHVDSRIGKETTLSFTYVQLEEASTGPRDGFVRGEDYALITSVQTSPWRGLDVRPLYAFLSAHGVTSGSARQGRGGLGTTATTYPTTPAATESRHTVGLDTQWRIGTFAIDPTVFYQWGTREFIVPVVAGIPHGGTLQSQDRSAWLVDVRAATYVGPLLVDAAAVYVSGNKAREDIRNPREKARFFEPIDTDSTYYFGLAEIISLGTDFSNILYSTAPGLNTGVAVGYDKYGLMRLGTRASYAPVPNLVLKSAVHHSWTAEDVDTRGALNPGSGITPSAPGAPGRHRDLGTEVDAGFQYRFAPHISLDVGAGWLFVGPGLATATSTSQLGVSRTNKHPHDVQSIATRVRYVF